MYVLFSLQPLKDVHLVMFVLVFLLVDLVILTIGTPLDGVRPLAYQVPDEEHGPELDVSMFVCCVFICLHVCLYVCLFVFACVFVCFVCLCVCWCVCAFVGVFVHLLVCLCICWCICLCCVFARVCACLYTYSFVHLFVCAFVRLFVHLYISLCVCMFVLCLFICMHVFKMFVSLGPGWPNGLGLVLGFQVPLLVLQKNIVQSSFSASLFTYPVPGLNWGVNHGSFSLNSSGPGGTSGAYMYMPTC